MSLNNVRVEAAKPKQKPYTLGDEKGLYLLVQPTGQKWWPLKYRFGPRKDGKPGQAEKMLSRDSRACRGRISSAVRRGVCRGGHVLHAFAKKTQQTSKQDIDRATVRYRELVEERKRAER